MAKATTLRWWYKEGESVTGPMTSAELKTKAAFGEIEPETVLRRSDTHVWVPAHTVKGLRFAQTKMPRRPAAESSPAIENGLMQAANRLGRDVPEASDEVCDTQLGVVERANAQPPEPAFKACPNCSMEIPYRAIICWHCQSRQKQVAR